jgi:hypothetical protein
MSGDEEQIVRIISADWIVPESIPTQRATHLIIQNNSPTEFVVSFFEQREPFFSGTIEQQVEQFYRVEKVSAVCVGRLVLSPKKLVEFADTFKRSVNEFHLTDSTSIKKEGDE